MSKPTHSLAAFKVNTSLEGIWERPQLLAWFCVQLEIGEMVNYHAVQKHQRPCVFHKFHDSRLGMRPSIGLLVAYWLKHWTTDRKIQGSSPTSSRDLFLFWVHSALPQKLGRRFSFASFEGDIKPSVSGNPLKLA